MPRFILFIHFYSSTSSSRIVFSRISFMIASTNSETVFCPSSPAKRLLTDTSPSASSNGKVPYIKKVPCSEIHHCKGRTNNLLAVPPRLLPCYLQFRQKSLHSDDNGILPCCSSQPLRGGLQIFIYFFRSTFCISFHFHKGMDHSDILYVLHEQYGNSSALCRVLFSFLL